MTQPPGSRPGTWPGPGAPDAPGPRPQRPDRDDPPGDLPDRDLPDRDLPDRDLAGAQATRSSGQDDRLLQHLHRLEPLLASLAHGAAHEAARVAPAWKRATAGELRWPVTVVVAGMVFLQLSLPVRFSLTGRWLLPTVEAALMVVLAVSNPRRITGTTYLTRVLGLVLIAVASLANGWSAVRLVIGLVNGSEGKDAVALLVIGGNIWLTNIIVFGLWYWELDRGGPAARALGLHEHPDFLFPEMATPELAEPDWEPQLVDYLYVAFTNATAFSPTDTMPFSRWSKLAMMLQSTISLVTGALVIARAVNILQ
ncbi:MAG TPA: hypothetical protein VFP72_13505 [Kineosporiaceae bacterium]|nr:hypothetical protein [Kineosporiaceae bacterium]